MNDVISILNSLLKLPLLYIYIYIILFIYLFLVMLGLRRYSSFSLFEVSDGYSPVTVCGWSTL